jgi:pimeloyl-ACP methyl ester carboxylesterase
VTHQVFEGDGDRTLVMLAGFGRSGSSWIPWLSQVGPLPFRVVLVDNRGTGRSPRSWRPYTLDALADDVAGLLDESPALVVGESMGGMIAQHLALRHPRLVDGLVLIASSAGGGVVTPSFLRSLPVTLAAAISKDSRAWARGDELLVHDTARAHELLAPLREIQRSEPYWPAVSLFQAIAVTFHRTTRRLSEIRVPVEIVAGASDRVLSPRNSEVLAAGLPDARLTLVEDAGHAIAFEKPMEIRAAITRLAARSQP